MISWEDRRKSGIEAARAELAELKDASGLLAAFAAWWKERDTPGEGGSGQLHLHPSTIQLAGELRTAGLDEAADFAMSQWVAEGPIHSGVWTFSILLGESFVAEFVDRLTAGNGRTPLFYGLEQFGAWDAFESLVRLRLAGDPAAAAAAMERLRLLVAQLKADPSRFMGHHERVHGNIRKRAERYATSPSIDEIWEGPFDAHVLAPEAFLWDVLLELKPTEVLRLLGDMPHPVFMRACLRGERLAKRPDEIAGLLKMAPMAFCAEETLRAEGAVVLLLLEIAEAAVRKTVMDVDGSIRVATVGESELLAPVIERCEVTITMLLDALSSAPTPSRSRGRGSIASSAQES